MATIIITCDLCDAEAEIPAERTSGTHAWQGGGPCDGSATHVADIGWHFRHVGWCVVCGMTGTTAGECRHHDHADQP